MKRELLKVKNHTEPTEGERKGTRKLIFNSVNKSYPNYRTSQLRAYTEEHVSLTNGSNPFWYYYIDYHQPGLIAIKVQLQEYVYTRTLTLLFLGIKCCLSFK